MYRYYEKQLRIQRPNICQKIFFRTAIDFTLFRYELFDRKQLKRTQRTKLRILHTVTLQASKTLRMVVRFHLIRNNWITLNSIYFQLDRTTFIKWLENNCVYIGIHVREIYLVRNWM